MRVWVAAGGTGGHFYPALAVVEELEKRLPEVEARFAVSRRGLEARVLSAQNRPFTTLMVEGFHRREWARNLFFPFTTAIGFGQSVLEVLRFRPHVAFGTGGFVSGPALLAARCLGVPVALVALDALPGVTIRLLAPVARKIYVSHGRARSVLGERSSVEVVGTPVRPAEPMGRHTARARLELAGEGFLLFVTGGSQGSAALNHSVSEALPALLEIPSLSLLWQTGRDLLQEAEGVVEVVMKDRPSSDRDRVTVRAFLDEMSTAWVAADLALCRAGAATIAELATHGVPALLVPLPTAAGGHQEANARVMAEAGAAVLLPSEELSGERLTLEIKALVGDEARLEVMATAVAGMAHGGATLRVAEGLVRIARWLGPQERANILSRFLGAGP